MGFYERIPFNQRVPIYSERIPFQSMIFQSIPNESQSVGFQSIRTNPIQSMGFQYIPIPFQWDSNLFRTNPTNPNHISISGISIYSERIPHSNLWYSNLFRTNPFQFIPNGSHSICGIPNYSEESIGSSGKIRDSNFCPFGYQRKDILDLLYFKISDWFTEFCTEILLLKTLSTYH
ncbi:hypothetical protein CEXT_693411 [Caerostris extrusa]|uniref:Uncharacterized protein n=1 Tax=Caerostris extrusa TaxID=172846 RepID=A0AAV4Q823_CAEEX|nr:hypothetical protein CEXT_693411 [Caerostris extrusa]